MLTEGRKDKENPVVSSPSREAYRKQLAETFNMNRTLILAFKNKTSERTLDAPGLIDDYFLNFLDWGSSNVLAIALGNTVYLWDATDGATFELEKCYTVLAIALGNTVYLWDATDGAISEQWFSY